jgi:hypothetical protein
MGLGVRCTSVSSGQAWQAIVEGPPTYVQGWHVSEQGQFGLDTGYSAQPVSL